MMKEQNEKYAALLTVLAVLISVIYSNQKFDLWDSWLGLLGFIFAMKFYKEITEKDKFLCLLVGALVSISSIAFVFPIISICKQIDIHSLKKILDILNNDLIVFSILTVILFFVIYWSKCKSKSSS